MEPRGITDVPYYTRRMIEAQSEAIHEAGKIPSYRRAVYAGIEKSILLLTAAFISVILYREVDERLAFILLGGVALAVPIHALFAGIGRMQDSYIRLAQSMSEISLAHVAQDDADEARKFRQLLALATLMTREESMPPPVQQPPQSMPVDGVDEDLFI